jgi:hypothetical protein
MKEGILMNTLYPYARKCSNESCKSTSHLLINRKRVDGLGSPVAIYKSLIQCTGCGRRDTVTGS